MALPDPLKLIQEEDGTFMFLLSDGTVLRDYKHRDQAEKLLEAARRRADGDLIITIRRLRPANSGMRYEIETPRFTLGGILMLPRPFTIQTETREDAQVFATSRDYPKGSKVEIWEIP